VAPGTWFTVFGARLSSTTSTWRASDFVDGRLPTELDGVQVLVNGRPVAVQFVSPTQINAQAPDSPANGVVAVQVKSPKGASTAAYLNVRPRAPGFFTRFLNGRQVAAAVNPDGSVVGPEPARSGHAVSLFGTGFGQTTPPAVVGYLLQGPMELIVPGGVMVQIGGAPAEVTFAGIVAPGLYQLNVVVPALPDGLYEVTATLEGVSTPSQVYLPVRN
jgi:uncharacterized protein (TIGR03437 family)